MCNYIHTVAHNKSDRNNCVKNEKRKSERDVCVCVCVCVRACVCVGRENERERTHAGRAVPQELSP